MIRSGRRRMARLGTVLTLLMVMTPLATAIAADETVTITDTLSPRDLTVAVGSNVTWQNNDDERHRMRSQSGPEEFDSGNIEAGQSFTFNFAIEGTYTYIDDRDEDNTAYHGTITVTADAPPTDPGDPPPPPPATGDVNIVDRSFQPSSLTVSAGGSVTWAIADGDEHTVTATDSSWDSGIFGPGATYTRSFADPGTYPYFCIIHPDMTGTITVLGDAGDPPPPPPPPDPEPDPTPPPPPVDGDVNIFDFGYTPGTLTVGVGSSVTWSNTGAAPHTVTDTGGTFDSGFLFAGDTYSRSFAAAGTYDYFCTLHPEMTATVVVTDGSGDPPPPAPPPPGPVPDPPAPPAPVSGDVNVFDFGYTPGTLTVGVGSSVTWSNTGSVPHTVTDSGGTFDSGFMFTGDTYSRTFNAAGTYDYICTLHPEMTGTVVVVGSGGGPPPGDPGDPGAPPSPAPATPVSGGVTIVDNAYSPRTKSITTGTTLVWTNTGAVPHTVTSSAGGFDSGFMFTGDTYRRTFTVPGTFDYICTIHPGMTGTVIVTGTPTGDPPPDDFPDPAAPPPAAGAAGPSSVSIVDNAFRPATLTVEAGQTISWANNGALPHTVTSPAAGFDSGILAPGAAFGVRLTTPGSYGYICTLHPEMTGTLIVTEASEPIDDSEGAVVVDVGGGAEGDAGQSAVGAGAEDAAPTIERTVQMIDNAFQPRDVTVQAGQAVRWRNDGLIPHTATVEGLFDSGFVNPGDDFVQVFDEVGVYDYICTIHPEMVGTIEVVAASAEVTAAGVSGVTPSAPVSPAVAYIMAGAIVVAVAAMAWGMSRFAKAAADVR